MLTVCAEGAGVSLTLTAQRMGRDWNVTITGGEVPHLGAAALGRALPPSGRARRLQRIGIGPAQP